MTYRMIKDLAFRDLTDLVMLWKAWVAQVTSVPFILGEVYWPRNFTRRLFINALRSLGYSQVTQEYLQVTRKCRPTSCLQVTRIFSSAPGKTKTSRQLHSCGC